MLYVAIHNMLPTLCMVSQWSDYAVINTLQDNPCPCVQSIYFYYGESIEDKTYSLPFQYILSVYSPLSELNL